MNLEPLVFQTKQPVHNLSPAFNSKKKPRISTYQFFCIYFWHYLMSPVIDLLMQNQITSQFFLFFFCNSFPDTFLSLLEDKRQQIWFSPKRKQNLLHSKKLDTLQKKKFGFDKNHLPFFLCIFLQLHINSQQNAWRIILSVAAGVCS